jgi:hypothetical protein
MHLGGVTADPTGEWTVQQARNLALTMGERFGDIRFLIRDRGSNFTASFDAVFQAAGTRILRTAVQAPRMKPRVAYCTSSERFCPKRPDQRVHARRLKDRTPAGHQPNPVSERDRTGRSCSVIGAPPLRGLLPPAAPSTFTLVPKVLRWDRLGCTLG